MIVRDYVDHNEDLIRIENEYTAEIFTSNLDSKLRDLFIVSSLSCQRQTYPSGQNLQALSGTQVGCISGLGTVLTDDL